VRKRHRQPVAADVAIAALHFNAGAYDKAASYRQEAITIQPKSATARTLMVRVLLAQGNVARAAQELSALQKEFPNSAIVFNLIGAQQLAAKNTAAARQAYARAAQLAPNDLEAVSGLVKIALDTGKTPEAIAYINSILKAKNPTPEFLVLAARTYAASPDQAKAEELLIKAIESAPNRLQAYGVLGQFYIKQNRLDAALDQYQQLVAKSPRSVSAITMLGMLLETQRRLPEAEQQYKNALAIDPRAAVAANNLAWLYVSSNRNLQEALQLAQTAQQIVPGEPSFDDTLGWIYYRLNMTGQARSLLESSAAKSPTEPAIHYHLGMTYARAGEVEKARQSLRRALSLSADFDGAAEARKTLNEIGS